MIEAMKLKKNMSQRTSETANMFTIVWITTAYVVAEAQTQVWEEFGEDIEMEFWSASKDHLVYQSSW